MKLACYKLFKIAIFACFVFSWAGISVAQADKEQEIKRIYKQLIDAENKHDLPAVRALVWNSPSTLFVAKAPVGWHGYWGIHDVMQHLHDMYQQPFRMDPIYEEEKVVFITPEIAETYAPVRITVAYGGQSPVPKETDFPTRNPEKQARHCAPTVHESIVFNALELALSESRFPDLLETLVVKSNRWSCWSRVACAQGRRATRLRYAPTVIALLILRHFLTVLLIFTIVFTADCARMGYCTVTVPIGAASRASADGGECLLLFRRA